jgi:hypothetical protein
VRSQVRFVGGFALGVLVVFLVAFAQLRNPDLELYVVGVFMFLVAGFMALAGVAYVVDVLVRPYLVARHARAAADARRKPLLNVGAGTRESSFRAWLFGPTLWGDVNLDIASPELWPAPDLVSYGDVQRLQQWPDRHFGAVIASHVLEHVEDPHLALAELHRVADEVYVITPAWWAPHTWLHPGHRWYRTPSGRFWRLARR